MGGMEEVAISGRKWEEEWVWEDQMEEVWEWEGLMEEEWARVDHWE